MITWCNKSLRIWYNWLRHHSDFIFMGMRFSCMPSRLQIIRFVCYRLAIVISGRLIIQIRSTTTWTIFYWNIDPECIALLTQSWTIIGAKK